MMAASSNDVPAIAAPHQQPASSPQLPALKLDDPQEVFELAFHSAQEKSKQTVLILESFHSLIQFRHNKQALLLKKGNLLDQRKLD